MRLKIALLYISLTFARVRIIIILLGRHSLFRSKAPCRGFKVRSNEFQLPGKSRSHLRRHRRWLRHQRWLRRYETPQKGLQNPDAGTRPHGQAGEYPTANLDSWDLEYQGKVPREEIATHYYKQNRLSWWVKQENKHWIVKDDERDYDEDQRFDWIRGEHVGGHSIM